MAVLSLLRWRLPLISQVPGDAHRIQLRQTLGLKLGIFDDAALDRLMPKQAESGVVRPTQQLKRTTMRILIGLLVQKPRSRATGSIASRA
ncbi:DNA primase [Kluyvera cryocrescens]|uniref:DNA primase n=1 Tax=Kluyvera cryocrescens TaxID=580 RepID=A0A485ALP8_KLUCR|nr:DNA primase [Kluyvera cryocrescens]